MSGLSTIVVKAVFRDGEYIPTEFTWDGMTRLTAMTFDLLDDADPRWVHCPKSGDVKVGDTVKVGPFVLKVTLVSDYQELVYLERVEDDMVIPFPTEGAL